MKLTAMAGVCLALFSCNEATTTTPAADSAAAETVQYVYTIDHPDSWEWGSKKNTETALNALKAFETGDIAGGMKYWGDSIRLQFDNFNEKMSNDSVKAMFTQNRANYTSLEIKMQDFESVISKNKEEEWVTLWYKQIGADSKGNVDSMACVDDLKFINGKIVLLDEKTRKLGPPKK